MRVANVIRIDIFFLLILFIPFKAIDHELPPILRQKTLREMALQGTKALETWCRLVTEGYEHVNIVNMTTSWRNGMGFCAIIHKFRPELILYNQLDPEDSFGNNELAFTTAEQHLGIPALLDPQDMVECEVLDRLSILTYLSQFYQTFHGATGPSKDCTPTKLR